MNQRAKWSFVHKARNSWFSTDFLSVFYRCFKFVVIWARPFRVAVCEIGAGNKTGRKLEAPLGRKLVENWRSATDRKLEFS